MRDGRVLTMDEGAVIREAEAVAQRAWSRLFAGNPQLPVPEGFRPLPPVEAVVTTG